MNVIPFVTVILLILGMFALSDFQREKNLSEKYKVYLTSLHAFRDIRNQQEEKNCDNKVEKLNEPQPLSSLSPTPRHSQSLQKEEASFHFIRNRYLGIHEAKINLFPLIEAEAKRSPFYKVVVAYIHKIYGHAEFYKEQKGENLAEKILKVLLQKMKKRWKEEHRVCAFEEVSFGEKSLEKVFYKMMRGTHYYDLEDKEGYPSFLDLFFCQPGKQQAPINFCYVPYPLLEVAFGLKLTQAIQKMEVQDTSKPLDERELEKIIHDAYDKQAQQNKNLFYWNFKPSLSYPIVEIDEKTKITIRQRS